jgi:hypothetical protein
VAVAAVGGVAILQAVRGGVHRYRLDRSSAFERTASQALGQAFRELVRLDGLTIDNVGISAWIVQRRVRKPWQKYLTRVGRLRLTSAPLPSRVVWTRGKGIIGRCWERENIVAQETKDLWEPHWTCTRAEWKGLNNRVKLRLKHKEWHHIRGKYRGAVAVPIVDDRNRFVGCISIDARDGAEWQALNRQEVVDIAAQAGTTVGNLMAFVARWVYTPGS